MVKEKNQSVRTYDKDGYRIRAACLCFRDESEQELLLVSSRRCSERFIVPGGGVEPLEEPNIAAEREVFEEAGVKGKIGRFLGLFENLDRKHRTSVYAFTVTELLEEWQDAQQIGRTRQWFSVEAAKSHLLQHKPVQVGYFSLLEHG